MCWLLGFLANPVILAHSGRFAKTTGRADLVACVERNPSTAPAGDVRCLLPFSH